MVVRRFTYLAFFAAVGLQLGGVVNETIGILILAGTGAWACETLWEEAWVKAHITPPLRHGLLGAGVTLCLVIGTVALLLKWEWIGSPMQPTGASTPTVASTKDHGGTPTLSPRQHGLLRTIHEHQIDWGEDYLMITFDGTLLARADGKSMDLVGAIFGEPAQQQTPAHRLNDLVRSMPAEYLRLLPATGYNVDFVVAVTQEGTAYLRRQ